MVLPKMGVDPPDGQYQKIAPMANLYSITVSVYATILINHKIFLYGMVMNLAIYCLIKVSSILNAMLKS